MVTEVPLLLEVILWFGDCLLSSRFSHTEVALLQGKARQGGHCRLKFLVLLEQQFRTETNMAHSA